MTGKLNPSQVNAIRDGLGSRVQLIQGPPGTGKTETLAFAIVTRILQLNRSRGIVALIVGPTHTAVDELLARIATKALPATKAMFALCKFDKRGKGPAPVTVFTNVIDVRDAAAQQPLIIGATVNSALELKSKLPLNVPLLVVDEASMMMTPHLMAIMPVLDVNGALLAAGDHRQLSPIVTHHWEDEDRPPVEVYEPHASVYTTILRLAEDVSDARRYLVSRLDESRRLPDEVALLLRRLYAIDLIDLKGKPSAFTEVPAGVPPLEAAWYGATGIALVIHDENLSSHSSPVEAALVSALLSKRPPGKTEIKVISPYRAHRRLLEQTLTGTVDDVQTVEKMQGGEADVIVFSTAVSDLAMIASNESFILNLNRSNVAFSRAKERLIVVCAQSLLDHVPADSDAYDEALLWKTLRELCDRDVGSHVVHTPSGSVTARVFVPSLAALQRMAKMPVLAATQP